MRRYAAVVLAAGQASRYRAAGGAEPTKLVANWRGAAIVRHVVRAALASRAAPVIVVTGHAEDAVRTALQGLEVTFRHNPLFGSGLASSLQAGIAALPTSLRGAVVLLGDMPSVDAETIDRLIDAATDHCDAVVPVGAGRRGNPVLLDRALFPRIANLSGDAGARSLLREDCAVIEVEMAGNRITPDVDTPHDLATLEIEVPS